MAKRKERSLLNTVQTNCDTIDRLILRMVDVLGIDIEYPADSKVQPIRDNELRDQILARIDETILIMDNFKGAVYRDTKFHPAVRRSPEEQAAIDELVAEYRAKGSPSD
jgi:hypothetical protein